MCSSRHKRNFTVFWLSSGPLHSLALNMAISSKLNVWSSNSQESRRFRSACGVHPSCHVKRGNPSTRLCVLVLRQFRVVGWILLLGLSVRRGQWRVVRESGGRGKLMVKNIFIVVAVIGRIVVPRDSLSRCSR